MTVTNQDAHTVELCSGNSVRDVPRQLIFGQLVKLACPVVSHYHSDLYHDAMWLNSHIPDGMYRMVFFYGVRSTGTSIGTDHQLVATSNDHVYRITVTNRRMGDYHRWRMFIKEL